MAVTIAPQQDLDLDSIEADATGRLGDLREQRARLALDALGDGEVARELEAVEAEIRSTEQALERVQLAGTEHGRRAAAARAAEEVAAREAALDRARLLQREREAGAVAVDAALEALAAAVKAWLSTCDEQDAALAEAGRPPSSNSASARAALLEGAFVASVTRSLPRGVLPLEGIVSPPQQKRLTEADWRPVEPVEA